MSQMFESLRMRVENENGSSHNKFGSRDWEWDESVPWESQFWDRDESLAEVWLKDEGPRVLSFYLAKLKGFWKC